MKKRVLSVLLAVAVLLSTVSVTGMLTALAVSAGWTAGANGVGQYKNFARYADLSTVVEGESLVKGMVPYGSRYGSGTNGLHADVTGTNYANGHTGNISYITDGGIGAQGENEKTVIRTNSGNARYFYFDLGSVHSITDFVVAPAQDVSASYASIKELRIYVASQATITTPADGGYSTAAATPVAGFKDNLVYEHTNYVGGQTGDSWTNAYNFHIQPTDGESVEARYVCFELVTTGAPITLGELAVYGTEVVGAEWQPGADGVGRYKNFDRYADLSTVVAGESLIKDMVPYGSRYGSSANGLHADVTGTNYANGHTGNISYITDGSIGAQGENEKTVIRTNSGNARYFYFDLGSLQYITDFVVAPAQDVNASYASIKELRIYVSQNATITTPSGDGYSTAAATPVAGFEDGLVYEHTNYAGGQLGDSWTDAYNFHIQPTNGEPVIARFVCFELVTASAPITLGELAVYNTSGQAGDFPVEPWFIGDAIDTDGNWMTNIYEDRANSSNIYMVSGSWPELKTNLADGDAATLAGFYAWEYEPGYTEVIHPATDEPIKGTSGWAQLTVELDDEITVEKLLLIGNKSGNAASRWGFSSEETAQQRWGENYTVGADNKYYAAYAPGGEIRTLNDRHLLYYEVYVGSSLETLYDEGNRVLSYDNTVGRYLGATHILENPKAGSFIGLRVPTGSSARVSIGELGVYGQKPETGKTETVKIVTVGDSITYGTYFKDLPKDHVNYNTTYRYTNRYSAVLEKLLDASSDTIDYNIVNVGISGSTVVNRADFNPASTERASSWLGQAESLGYIQQTDVLTIMLGTNDANNDWDSRKGIFKEKYIELVEAFRALNPDLKLYIATSPYAVKCSNQLEEAASLQKALARDLGATVIDVFTATKAFVAEYGEAAFINQVDLDRSIRLHPNEEGHAFLAETFFEGMTGTPAEEVNVKPWYLQDPIDTENNWLVSATVDTGNSSSANGKWETAKPLLTDGDAAQKASLYLKDYAAGYADVTDPDTGAPIKGTSGWAQVMFTLTDYIAVEKILLVGSPDDSATALWNTGQEADAIAKWGENYTLGTDGKYYAAYTPGGERRTFDNKHLLYYEVYVSDMPGTLFDQESLVLSYDNSTNLHQGVLHALLTPAEGSYIGIRVTGGTGNQARIGELAVYGQKATRANADLTPWNVGNTIPTEDNLLADAERVRDNATGEAIASNLGEDAATLVRDGDATTKGSYYLYEYEGDIAENYAEATNPVTGETIKYTSGWARIAFKLDRYSLIDSVLLIGSASDRKEQLWSCAAENDAKSLFGDNYTYQGEGDEGRYYAAYAPDGEIRQFNNRNLLYYEVYVSDKVDTLFDADNLVLAYNNARALYDGAAHRLETPAEGRYVGFRVTGGSNNQARIGELGVYGHTVDKDITVSAETDIGTVSMTVSADSTADRDALQQTIGSLRVTTEKLDATVATNIAHNWLTVDGKTVYHVQLLDKNGKVFPDKASVYTAGLNGRPVQVMLPSTEKHMQLLGRVSSGEIERVFNSYESLDGLVIGGSLEYPEYSESMPNNRAKAVISTGDLRLVFLKFNDLTTINQLNNNVVNTPLSEFRAAKVAGASDSAPAPVLPAVTMAAACVAVVAAVGLLVVSRKSRRRDRH